MAAFAAKARLLCQHLEEQEAALVERDVHLRASLYRVPVVRAWLAGIPERRTEELAAVLGCSAETARGVLTELVLRIADELGDIGADVTVAVVDVLGRELRTPAHRRVQHQIPVAVPEQHRSVHQPAALHQLAAPDTQPQCGLAPGQPVQLGTGRILHAELAAHAAAARGDHANACCRSIVGRPVPPAAAERPQSWLAAG